MIKRKEDTGLSVAELLAFLKSIEIIVDKSESKEEIKQALIELQSLLKAR